VVQAMRRHLGVGLLAMILSCAAFGTAGPFAKALIGAGWSPGAVVLARITGAALLLLPFTAWTLRGRWASVRRDLPLAGLYGTLAVAAAQLGYFQAVERLTVGVALLIEYLGIVLVVLWVWLLTRQAPHRLTLLGIVLAIAGLAMAIGIPALQNLVVRSRTEGFAREISSLVQRSRLEAIRRNRPAIVYLDESAKQIAAFVDIDGNGSFDPDTSKPKGAADFELDRLAKPDYLTFTDETGTKTGIASIDEMLALKLALSFGVKGCDTPSV